MATEKVPKTSSKGDVVPEKLDPRLTVEPFEEALRRLQESTRSSARMANELKALEAEIAKRVDIIRNAQRVLEHFPSAWEQFSEFIVYVPQELVRTVRVGMEAQEEQGEQLRELVTRSYQEQIQELKRAYVEVSKHNAQLTKEIDELKRQVQNNSTEETEDDSRLFGTHIREAWHALTGR